MKALFYFHEQNRIEPWRPEEDKTVIDLPNDFIAIADGTTRDIIRQNHTYPEDFHGGATAELFVNSAKELQDDFDYSKNGMDDLLHEINKRIYERNQTLGFDYEKPEQYWKPECVGGIVKVVDGTLYYGVMEDIYINVLRGGNMEDQVKMKHTLLNSFNIAMKEKEKDPTLDFEQYWCTKLRNNVDAKDSEGTMSGWGSFNGEQGAAAFWQTGEIELKPGDTILIVTNGALDLFRESQFNKQAEEIIFRTGSSTGVSSQDELSKLITQMISAGQERLNREKTVVRALWNMPPLPSKS